MTEPFNADHFRAELLLQMPDVGACYSRPEATHGVNHDYDRDALAAWIVDQMALAATAAVDETNAGLDARFGAIAERAGAAGVINAAGEFSTYLRKLGVVLRRGLSLSDAYDLARTCEAEAARLEGMATGLLSAYPDLAVKDAPNKTLARLGDEG